MEDNIVEVIVFILDGHKYCIETTDKVDLATIENLTPVGNTKDMIDGIMMHRDDTVTVVNTRKMLNIPEDKKRLDTEENKDIHNYAEMNVALVCNNKIAFTIDEIGGIQKIDKNRMKSPSELMLHNIENIIKAMVVLDNNSLGCLLNVDGIREYLIT